VQPTTSLMTPGPQREHLHVPNAAAILTLARAFAKATSAHTLRFVSFTNEEPPLFQTRHMGSRVYAKRGRERGEKIALILSLETIGYYSDERGEPCRD